MMVSCDARRTRVPTVRIIALAVIAAASATFAQPDSPSVAEDALQERIAEIADAQSLLGGISPDLIEPLTALSLLYEERGDYALALALIEEATKVIEVNYGLHTLDEAELMRRTIRIERARGNAEAAWNEEQELLVLMRRHPNDARIGPILREIADERRAILARYQDGELPPEITLGCYYDERTYDESGFASRNCRSGSRRAVVRKLRREASVYDAAALRLARWVELPCARPEAQVIGDERHSNQRAREVQAYRYLRAVSDFVRCTQVKYEHAASTNASQEELSQLAATKTTAAEELAQAVNDASLTIKDAHILAIIGPDGCRQDDVQQIC